MCLIEVVAAGIDPKATPPPPTHFQIQNWRTRPIVAADVGPRGHTVEKTKTSQAKPMTTWCLLVVALVMTFIAIGVALFFTPGHGQPLQKNAAPTVLTK